MSLTLVESEAYLEELEHQLHWYVYESKLDLRDGIELAQKFKVAVEDTVEFLLRNPAVGRRRFPKLTLLQGTRSWRVDPPFDRFLIYYHVEGETLFVDRLIEGHRQITTDNP